MSIYLTSAPLGTFPPSSTKPTLFFSRAPPLNNFLACAAGSPAPQAKKFSSSVHLWVKLQATKLTFRMPWSRTCLPDQGLTGLVSASLRHFLTVRHSSSTKIFIFRTCSSHSTLIWCLGTHIPQLVGAWWLLYRQIRWPPTIEVVSGECFFHFYEYNSQNKNSLVTLHCARFNVTK